MGKHFDSLVEIVKSMDAGITSSYIKDYKFFLEGLINNCALFDLPLGSKDIIRATGKDEEEYNTYISDYLAISKNYKTSFLKPFPVTAIEDNESVVIVTEHNNYLMVTFCENNPDSDIGPHTYVTSGGASFLGLEKSVKKMLVDPSLHVSSIAGKIYVLSQMKDYYEEFSKDMGSALNTYIEECAYIMDPENFIVIKESTGSLRLRQKANNGKKIKKLQKTVMRPHFMCLSDEDLRCFLTRESDEPRPAHPVKGHFRRLMSDKFVNKKGQRIYVKQYFTGNGSVKGKNGWHYQVMVKESPVDIVEYR